MSRRTSNRSPSFLWQGVLILLPVGLLVGASVWAIQRDYHSVEDDAVQEAQILAERWAKDLAHHLGEAANPPVASILNGSRAPRVFAGKVAVHETGAKIGIRPEAHIGRRDAGPFFTETVVLDERGLLPLVLWPDAVPVPPAWPSELSGESLRCWDRALTEPAASTNAARLWDEFLATAPSAPARANAELRRLLAEKPDVAPLLNELRRIGRVPTESGLPLAALGLAHLAERFEGDDSRLTAQSALWGEAISPELFDHVLSRTRSSFPQLRYMVEKERRRLAMIFALSGRLGGRGPVQSSAWIEVSGQRTFAWAASPEENRRSGTSPAWLADAVIFVPAETLKASLGEWATDNGLRKGGPFSLGVTLEGESLGPILVRKGGEKTPRVLASATAPLMFSSLKSSLSVRAPSPTANSIPTNVAVFPAEMSFEVPPPTIRPASVGVTVFLADPAALFARARSRAWLMGSITLGAAAVSVLGFLLARRAFHRQLALNEQKSNFVSAVSHELRAPIAAVRLMTENLTRGAPAEPERQREYFGLILQECRRLSSLVENVLDFSRIEQGRKEYDMEPTDLAALTETTVRLLEPVAANQGVRLVCAVDRASLPGNSVHCDARAIQQALVNLIDNALKHAPAGTEVSVELSGQPTPDPSQEGNSRSAPERASSLRRIPSWEGSGVGPSSGTKAVFLSVTDHGPGVPADEREKVFAQFYRLGSELRRETQGIGIGLSLVRSIVEAHGGRVWLEEAPGGGCHAVIALPMANAATEGDKC